MRHFLIAITTIGALGISCSDKLAPVKPNALKPIAITEPAPHDTDDPAIWIHPTDASKSLIIGTDKDTEGGLYVYNLEGKIVNKVLGIKRPNNVDIAYGLILNGKKTDIAVTTEREMNRIRIFSLPDMKPIDNGGITVFDGELERDPMGIALYTRPSDKAIFVVVGRKSGPTDNYLWQYKLSDGGSGTVKAEVIRRFGKYSAKKEIEAIAVDNELGFIYYSDEQSGIRKYVADPDAKNNNELAFFGQKDFKADNEGIAIYKKTATTGYILVSNQQDNTFNVYPREGANGNPNEYPLLAVIPASTVECDGADVTNVNLGSNYKNGMFVAMSNGMTFHFYDWNQIQALIDKKY